MNQYIELKQIFFTYNRGRLTGEQFMRYVHSNKWLEYILSRDDYIRLLKYDAKEYNKRTKVKKILFKYYDRLEYEREFINLTLSSILSDLNDFDSIRYALAIIQNIYLEGNMKLEEFATKYQIPKLHHVMKEEDKQLIYEYLPRLIIDTKELLHKLNSERDS